MRLRFGFFFNLYIGGFRKIDAVINFRCQQHAFDGIKRNLLAEVQRTSELYRVSNLLAIHKQTSHRSATGCRVCGNVGM